MGNDRVEKFLGKRWLVLALAAIAGFVGSGVAMSSATILRIFVALFFAVFLLALAFSILMEPAPVEPLFEPEERGPSYVESPQVGHEAVYGSS